MFIGHIELAARMFEKNISFDQLRKYLDNIDFTMANPLWEEVGILKYGNISSRNKMEIRKLFQQLIQE